MKNTEKKMKDLVKIVQPLVDWYRENKRDLPWRHNPDAYRVWISEIYAAADKGGSCKRMIMTAF